MANNLTTDGQLAAILGDTPRRRRAAAVAAQKSWQQIEDEEGITENDIIFVEEKTQTKIPTMKNITPIRLSANTGIRSGPAVNTGIRSVTPINPSKSIPTGIRTGPTAIRVITPSIKRPAPTINPLIINMKKTKKTIDSDVEYLPNNDKRIRDLRSNTYAIIGNNQFAKNNIRIITFGGQNTTKLTGQQLIEIISDQSTRTIIKDNIKPVKKPLIKKAHPNEPDVLPIVAEEVEEIVGTYDVLDDNNNRENEESIDDLQMLCETETQLLERQKTKQNLEQNEEIENKDNINNSSTVVTQVISKNVSNITVIKKSDSVVKINGKLDSICGSLEMNCESFDDEFTDGLCIECDEDILNANQWNKAKTEKEKYKDYCNIVSSTKNVKFLPEKEVTESLGIVTTTVSETTKVITTPARPPPTPTPTTTTPRTYMTRGRIPNLQTVQSLVNPISSTNINTSQVINLPSVQNCLPIYSNPLTLLANTPSSTGSSPLILTSSLMAPRIPSGVQVLLPSSGSNQSTYLMVTGPNGNLIPATNIYTTNQTNSYQQNTPNIGQRISYMAPIMQTSPQIVRPATNVSTVNRPTRSSITVIRPPNPQRIRGPNIGFRQPVPRLPNTGIRTPRGRSPNPQTLMNSEQQFDCLTSIFTVNNNKINMRTILTIKPLPESWPSNIDDLIGSLVKLDNALMREKFKESPITWMVNSRLIIPPKCKICNIGFCNQVNKTGNNRNEYWNCNNISCNAGQVIDRPKIFMDIKFDIPTSKLLFIIYYWSIQVDVEDLIKTGQIEMGPEKIFNVWQQLQKVCSFALRTKDAKLGSKVMDVEVATIKVGQCVVLGAMEDKTRRVKVAVFALKNNNSAGVLKLMIQTLIKWLDKNITIKTCESKFTTLNINGFKVQMISKNVILPTNKNLSLTSIGGYLTHHLSKFFKDFDLSSLGLEIIQNILDELLWRERYGTNPYTAFYNIIKHIGEQCGLRKNHYTTNIVNNTSFETTDTSASLNTNNIQTYSSNRVINRQINIPVLPVLDETNSVFVDEYFYSSLKLKTTSQVNNTQEEVSNKDSIQCHLCQMFFNNILIVKHLLEHLEVERGGRVRKGDNNESECKHCLRFFTKRSLHMHEELTTLKVIPFSCRICLMPYYARQPFIQHMKTTHYAGEMPYYCDICSYRSSFQKNLLDHFEDSHTNECQIMCPFCIRVFHLAKFKNFSQFIYRHIQNHYAVASVYDCEKCGLTFATKPDLKDHYFRGHNLSNTIDEKFEIQTFVVQEEDKNLCIRAREEELFTPFLPNIDNTLPNYESNINSNNNNNEEMSFEPNILDLLSIEPECNIDISDSNTPFESFVLPVDCDYTVDQLKTILTNSFDLKPKSEVNEANEMNKPLLLFDSNLIVCFECNVYLSPDHFIGKSVCEKCNFSTHCRNAFDEHKLIAHSSPVTLTAAPGEPQPQPQQTNQSSVLKSFSHLTSYNIHCGECDFTTTDGNLMALHMNFNNHLISLCKQLSQS
ncbi:uncharacterized protein LOC128960605 [Oppia nitens]|uniref:uncharacterized protein LOC128960605 n=1 Tax=Oppia nitens TaxID=1686743 RepID=UPI0023DC9B38|nr:uncharacterized protein LOC128960605 [Oppia nitens]